MSRNALVRRFGWPALMIQGDILFAGRVSWVRRRLLPGPLRTLDAGCGAGALTILASRLGNNALGLTFDATDAALAAERAGLAGGTTACFRVVDLRDLARFAPELGRFDQIIACEVIEHLKDDAGLICNLAAMLEPGGRLLLTTPSADHHPVFGERVSETEDGGHVRFGYTHADLDRLLAGAGLEAEERGYLGGWFAQRVFSLYVRLYRLHPKLGWAATLPLRPLRLLDPVLGWLTGYPPMAVTVVALKPRVAV